MRWFRRSSLDLAARRMYQATVEQARQPDFYSDWRVPDTAIGRFDLIALHGFLVVNRLQATPRAAQFAQTYCGVIFEDMDRNLREMGVGDLSVGKKVRKLAEGFYGRAAAYKAALTGGTDSLGEVLGRNVYADAPPDPDTVAAMAAYVQRCVDRLADQDARELMEGRVAFAPLREEAGG